MAASHGVASWEDAGKAWTELQHLRHERPDTFKGYLTGITKFDELTGGLQLGTYLMVIAKNQNGKTGTMITFAGALSRNLKTVFLTEEMSNLKLMDRIVANGSFINMNVFRDLHMKDEDWIKAQAFCENDLGRRQGGLIYGYRDIDDIDKIVALNQPQVLIVDYGNLLTYRSMGGKASGYERYTAISHYLKNLTLPPMQGSGFPELEAARAGFAGLRIVISAVQVDKMSKVHHKIEDFSARDTQAWVDDPDIRILINDVATADGKGIIEDIKEWTVGGRATEGGTFRVHFNRAQARFEDDVPLSENPREPIP